MTRNGWLWIAFLAVTLAVAGVLSYFASSSPDGLDAATLRGCVIVESGGTEELTGDCIAQHASEHPMSASPMADYAGGGVVGMVGVLVTLAVAGSSFWLLSRSRG